jgi:alcohol dehydrogenase (cytochrome c)
VGIGGADEGTRGFIDAFDAETGTRSWRFWTVPEPGSPGSETWTGSEFMKSCTKANCRRMSAIGDG